MTTDTAFWDKISRKYAKSPISNMAAYEATLDRVRQYLGAEDSALEIGCGTGSTALLLADRVKSYMGTDVSPGMIEIAEEKRKTSPVDGLEFSVSSADNIPTGQFDIVLGFNILHLVPNPETTIAKIHEALPDGGMFISKTPCVGKRWYLRPLVPLMALVGKAPGTVHFLTVEQCDDMVRSAGFEIVETGLYPPKTPSRFIVARKR